MARPLCLHLAPGSEMEALLLLIPLSLLLMAIAAVALVWGVEHKQFDDLDRAALSVLEEPDHERIPERCGVVAVPDGHLA